MDLAYTLRTYALIIISTVSYLFAQDASLVVDIHAQPTFEGIAEFLPTACAITEIVILADAQSEYILRKAIPERPIILDEKLLKKIITYAVHTKRFTHLEFHLKPMDDAFILHIKAQRAWLFDRVTINGFLFGKDIFKRLYLMQTGDYFDHGQHEASCKNILMYLRQHGYFGAQIKDQILYDEERKMVSIKLAIIHGDQCIVDRVEMIGNNHLGDHYFQSLINHTYDQEEIDKQYNCFKKYLIEQGYFPLSFAINPILLNDTKRVVVQIKTTLSEQRKFLFYGNFYLDDQQLLQAISTLGKSAWIIPSNLLADILVQEYRCHGFENVHVDAKCDAIDYIFTIQEGLRTKEDSDPFKLPVIQVPSPVQKKFGVTVIQNLSTIPNHYIERELLYEENSDWDSELVRQTIRNLNNLQVFDQVSLINVFNPTDPDRSTMLLKIHNDLPYEFRLKGGIGLQQMSKDFIFKGVSYVAGGSFLIKNPFNRADLLSIDADYTFGEQNLAIRYTYPWLFNLRMRTHFEIYVNQYLQPGLRHNHKNIYSFVQQGFLIGTHYENGPLESQCNVGLEWMKTKVVDRDPFVHQEITHALYFEPLLLDKKIPYVLVEPQVVVNATDNKLNPTMGHLSLVSCKTMIPWRYLSLNSFFLKMLVDHSSYLSINSMVLAFRARVGHIFYKDFKNVMPAERFYLGGANSIRSYQTDMCPPLGTIVNEQNRTNFIPQGARSMVNINVELRIPTYRGLWIALFQDLGALSNNYFADIRAKDVLAGTGFGIRYQTPVGPLRFDVAFKWRRPDPRISCYCWFLSFGNAF